jgi:hypothetical protein
VNDSYRELKQRIRTLDQLLAARGMNNLPFAQALSKVRRVARDGDRSRDPSPELRVLLEKAETLGRMILG